MSPRRVRRSELTCPGHSIKMMAKAAESLADMAIFDLEDACAVSQKVSARQTVIEAFKTVTFTDGKLRAYRINGLDTPWWKDDLDLVLEQAGDRIDVVVVPKLNAPHQVQQVAQVLERWEQHHRLAAGTMRIEVLIETAKGVINAAAIATASDRLDALIFGVADYAGDTGARDFRQHAEQLFYYPRAHILAAARAAGLLAIDSVTVQFKDLAQVERDAQAGARLGYDGKWAIHPSQLPAIHAAYTPTADEIAHAQKVLAAYEQADKDGLGAIVIDDEMVDAATLKVEEKKLAIARRAKLI